MNSITKNCVRCNTEFVTNKKTQKYCGVRCRSAAEFLRYCHKYPEKRSATNKRYRDSHVEKIKDYLRYYYETNYVALYVKYKKYREEKREKILAKRRENKKNVSLEYQREYRKNHLDETLEYQRKWKKTESGKHHAKQNSYLRRSKTNGTFTASEWRTLCDKYDNRCLCCGEQKELTVDHVVSLKDGGSNTIDNLQPLCRSCNSRKGAKFIDYRS